VCAPLKLKNAITYNACGATATVIAIAKASEKPGRNRGAVTVQYSTGPRSSRRMLADDELMEQRWPSAHGHIPVLLVMMIHYLCPALRETPAIVAKKKINIYI